MNWEALPRIDLVALLLEQATEEMPTPPPRSSMPGPHDSAKKTLKGHVESEAKKENQEKEDIDLTLHENKRAFKGGFKSFVMPSGNGWVWKRWDEKEEAGK